MKTYGNAVTRQIVKVASQWLAEQVYLRSFLVDVTAHADCVSIDMGSGMTYRTVVIDTRPYPADSKEEEIAVEIHTILNKAGAALRKATGEE